MQCQGCGNIVTQLHCMDFHTWPEPGYARDTFYLKGLKGIHWQLDKLGLKVVFCLDKNDGESHFAELGSSWPGEAKTWPKIVLRVGGRAEKYCVGGRAAGCYWAARPPRQNIPPVLQHVALFLATF